MSENSTIAAIRAQLMACNASAIVLTEVDNVGYASGFASVMDG